MRLIDKDAAYAALKHEEETHGLSFSAEAYGKAARIIDSMPAIESEPKRGCEFCKGRAYSTKPLTVITRTMKHVQTVFNFCPNCGRQMCAEPTESEVQDDD